MKIIVAEDHHMVRKGIVRILHDSFPSFVTVLVDDGHQLVEKVRQESFDLIITDLSMPGLTGFEALQQIRMFSNIPVIVLSMHTEMTFSEHAFLLGAQAYIQKDRTTHQLVNTIKEILALK
jgi:DNA-binding NarL/FixJ family response regulator